MNIEGKIIVTSKLGYLKNLITLQNRDIILDITQDIPYIQANFKTRNFLGYNDNIELDKKIGYIKDNYNETSIEKSLKNIYYNKEDTVETILNLTSKIIDIKNIKPIELSIIYEEIFSKYCPNYDIKIHNLYLNCYPDKEHFIIIDYNNKLYSYNYTKQEFVKISQTEIIQNIEEQKIGIYLNEKIPFLTNKGAKALT